MTLTSDKPRINPLLPKDWRWVGLRNLLYHGRKLSYFVTREQDSSHVYSTMDVESDCVKELFDEDLSDRIAALSGIAPLIALRRGGEFMILVGSTSAQTTSVPLDLSELLEPDRTYGIRLYNSERDAWEERDSRTGADLTSLSVSVEGQGFRLIHLQER